ncbi:MAG: formate--tetrahydrofolate ligase [Proteobacteria bacterium]|nr:formate--tetrahydrofolate ligase [Pseudomonadota bacterium]MCP4920431.1 formate--tetrahydrofolate ligase [Pseudomonadota bacterium]
MKHIHDVAARLGLTPEDIIPFGHHKAKVPLSVMDKPNDSAPAKLILVSALTPTSAGEGKTTTSIGLGQALTAAGEKVCLALREPSLGPCFGVKGGGTGGGASKLEPSTDINLHFNGDFHAITSAHNLLSSVIDNHLHFSSDVKIDPRRVVWPRVIDLNDRSLRSAMIGLGGPKQGQPRQESFDITAASEVMAILCLANDLDDLRRRIDNILVGFRPGIGPVYARDLKVTGAMMALLKDAIVPNLVQSTEGTPALVHGGPFANIAHGCNSVIATRMAMHLADWVVTEAGFGMDLGGEKFLDIKCPSGGFNPNLVVLVATVRALKLHGGVKMKDLATPDVDAVKRGLPNVIRHIESVQAYGKPVVVAMNRFHQDTPEEIEAVVTALREHGVTVAESEHFMKGGEGAAALARAVIENTPDEPGPLTRSYDWSDSLPDKLNGIARRAYGARQVVLTADAKQDLRRIRALGHEGLPVCVAKTQYSLSDDPKKLGRPEDFDITVRSLKINSGAGFIVAITGDILRMPGLPKRASAENVDLVDGEIVGVG